jgi:hypothetical protein
MPVFYLIFLLLLVHILVSRLIVALSTRLQHLAIHTAFVPTEVFSQV